MYSLSFYSREDLATVIAQTISAMKSKHPKIFNYDPEDKRAMSWCDGYIKLVGFYVQHGHCQVTQGNSGNDDTFVTWVKTQRSYVKEGTVRREALDSLKFTWNVHAEKQVKPAKGKGKRTRDESNN
jgi:hypothetical protein